MKYRVYSNGREVSDRQAFSLLREEDGGVFESMRAYGGKIFRLEDHLDRLEESAKTVGCRPFPERRSLRREAESALRTSGEEDTSVRLTFCGGKIFVIIGSRKISPDFYEKGVTLKTSSFPRGSANAFPYQVKASVYHQAILASTEPHPEGIFEWLFLDRGNYLAETRTGNFFLVKYRFGDWGSEASGTRAPRGEEAVLLTPPEHLILNGVTRRFVIKCARELGVRVRETPLTRHDFFNADEAFLCNTSWEVLPVRELDGRMIGNKVPGPVTLKLHRLLTRRIQEDVTPTHSSRPHQRLR
ncbi:MAG TPA: aminotransferase class IV [Candidatus Omnitrophota bacterium]|nr:aminotransferase class IV [Candidatus Omnitrophota bacterium]HPS36224.1 aminotransferase class IV [Candidatus Omnitrophota bacterium]